MGKKLEQVLDKFWIARDLYPQEDKDLITLWSGGPPKEVKTTCGYTNYDEPNDSKTSLLDSWQANSEQSRDLLAMLNLAEIPRGSILEFSVVMQKPETLTDQVNGALRSKSVNVKNRTLKKVLNKGKL